MPSKEWQRLVCGKRSLVAVVYELERPLRFATLMMANAPHKPSAKRRIRICFVAIRARKSVVYQNRYKDGVRVGEEQSEMVSRCA